MTLDRRSIILGGAAALTAAGRRQPCAGAPGAGGGCLSPARAAGSDVRQFGAKGDGTTIDTLAINKAIDHAAARGGGTVYFPAGTYACYTIRLKSRDHASSRSRRDHPRGARAGQRQRRL